MLHSKPELENYVESLGHLERRVLAWIDARPPRPHEFQVWSDLRSLVRESIAVKLTYCRHALDQVDTDLDD